MSSTAIQNFPFLNVRPLEGNDYMYNNSSFQFFYITKGYVFISYINMVFKTSNSGWKISKPLQSPQAGVFNFLFFFWSEKHPCAWLWVLVESPCRSEGGLLHLWLVVGVGRIPRHSEGCLFHPNKGHFAARRFFRGQERNIWFAILVGILIQW